MVESNVIDLDRNVDPANVANVAMSQMEQSSSFNVSMDSDESRGSFRIESSMNNVRITKMPESVQVQINGTARVVEDITEALRQNFMTGGSTPVMDTQDTPDTQTTNMDATTANQGRTAGQPPRMDTQDAPNVNTRDMGAQGSNHSNSDEHLINMLRQDMNLDAVMTLASDGTLKIARGNNVSDVDTDAGVFIKKGMMGDPIVYTDDNFNPTRQQAQEIADMVMNELLDM